MNVLAKFQCVGVKDDPEYKQKHVSFSAVYEGENGVNRSFAKYTPSGNLSISISYETPAVDFFEQGKDYFLEFSKAE